MKIRIKELCQRCNITQKDLAERLGVSEVTLSRTANGNTSLPLLERIATALGVSIGELFEPTAQGVITCPHCGKPIQIDIKPS